MIICMEMCEIRLKKRKKKYDDTHSEPTEDTPGITATKTSSIKKAKRRIYSGTVARRETEVLQNEERTVGEKAFSCTRHNKEILRLNADCIRWNEQ